MTKGVLMKNLVSTMLVLAMVGLLAGCPGTPPEQPPPAPAPTTADTSGVAEVQLATVSYGEERPAVAGSDEQAYAANRRVEIVYLK